MLNDYHSKNNNYELFKLMSKSRVSGSPYGLICDFDVTGVILESENILRIRMYFANKGNGAKLIFCSDPTPPASNDHCQFLTSFRDADSIDNLSVTDGGFNLNKIDIKKGSTQGKVSVKIGEGTVNLI